MQATASFTFDSFDGEPPYLEDEEIKHARVRIEKSFLGDLIGHGSVEMLGETTWGRWPVVPGSGTGDLRGIRGEGRIDIDAAGNHTFILEYEID